MAVILLAMGLQTRPVLPLSHRFEQGARVVALPYAHGRLRHSSKCRNFKLFVNYSSFIQFLHMFSLHCNIGMKNCRPSWRRKRQHTSQRQTKGGGYGSRRLRGSRPRFSSRWPRCTHTFKVFLFKQVNHYHRMFPLVPASAQATPPVSHLTTLYFHFKYQRLRERRDLDSL